MLRLAVKRDSRARDARAKHSPLEVKASDQLAYLICDSRSKGYPIRHVSQGFEALFGGTADEYVGAACTQILGKLDASAVAALNKVAVTAGLNETGVVRMSKATEQALQNPVGGGALPLLLVAKRSGDLFVCEVSMSKNQHPTLGWPYLAGLIRDVSCEISLEQLLASAQTDESYAKLRSEWEKKRTAKGGPCDMSSLTDELHEVAKAMWKDELQKGIKPKGQKLADADTSSIWSRSTASTLASQTASERGEKAFHFGALLGTGVEHSANAVEVDDAARKRLGPEPRGRSVRAKVDEDGFQTADEDDKEWEECETGSPDQSLNSGSSSLHTDVVNPIKHVDRPVLRNMKIPFVIAAPTVPGFPICLRSRGFEDMFGPSMHVKVGCDAREVLKPSNAKDVKAWQHFFDAIMQGQFYLNENAEMLDGWQWVDGGRLPAGELAFMQTFCGRFGNPMECLVYLKHVELDDCPFLLALHAYVPSDAEQDSSPEKLFQRLNSRLDEVISEMAAEYVYYAPMRRQMKCHPDQ